MRPSTFDAAKYWFGSDASAAQPCPDSGTTQRGRGRSDVGGGLGRWRRSTNRCLRAGRSQSCCRTNLYLSPAPGTRPSTSRHNQTPPTRPLGGDSAERFPQDHQ